MQEEGIPLAREETEQDPEEKNNDHIKTGERGRARDPRTDKGKTDREIN